MERIEEFVVDGKNFIYIDFSGISANDGFSDLVEVIKPVIAKYPEKSLYTITNIEDTRFDSGSRVIMSEYMKHNSAYVKYGAVIGLDGIKKIITTSAFKMSGRTNMYFASSRENAIEWLLQQE